METRSGSPEKRPERREDLKKSYELPIKEMRRKVLEYLSASLLNKVEIYAEKKAQKEASSLGSQLKSAAEFFGDSASMGNSNLPEFKPTGQDMGFGPNIDIALDEKTDLTLQVYRDDLDTFLRDNEALERILNRHLYVGIATTGTTDEVEDQYVAAQAVVQGDKVLITPCR